MKFWASLLLLCSVACSFSAAAQPLKTYTNVQCLDMAPNGTLYFFSANNLVAWQNGKELFRFHTQGKTIANIDARNGFEILAFYQLQQSFQLFDNRLSEITPVMLLPNNLWVNNIKQSVNNEFWTISNNTQRLSKLSKNMMMLSQQNQAYFEHLQLVKDLNGKLIAHNTNAVMVFSNTGALLNEITIENISAVALINQQLYVCADNTIYAVSLTDNKKTPLTTLPDVPTHFAVFGNTIYYLNGGSIQEQVF